jgi:hypothetical protein
VLSRRTRTLVVWCGLSVALARFILGGISFSDLETVDPQSEWIRLVTLIRMLGFRRRVGFLWPYRPRLARLIRRLNRRLPEWIAYRGLILPICAANLARMSFHNVARFGKDLRTRTGLSLVYQFADVLRVCLKYPGAFPTEYYVFGMHLAEIGRRAPDLANGYEVEVVAALVRPARYMLHGSGFVSEELELLNDKEKFRDLCEQAGVSTAPVFAVFSAGDVRWSGVQQLPKQDLFLKPLRGGGGYGAARVFYDAAGETYRLDTPIALLTSDRYPTEPMTATALIAWLQRTGRQLPFVIEPRLKTHPRLADLVGNSTLPTLRVLTMSDRSGACSLLYVYLRAATTDSPVDNISTGGIAAMIDPQTGRLGAGTTSYGGVARTHPLTGLTLEGFDVPCVGLACVQSIQVHRALTAMQDLPVPILGSDVAVTDAGPVFVEGNVLSDLSTAQKLLGKGSWASETFRSSLLSYLVPLKGSRISVDPGAGDR